VANVLKITVDNPAEVLNTGAYGAGAVLRVQSAAAEAGPFTDVSGSGSTPTIPIVLGDTVYTGYDPNGTTDAWYRTRYENAGATRASDWSDAFQLGRQTYADLDDLKEHIEPPDDSKDNLLLDLLKEATDALDEICERSFLAGPVGEVRLFNGADRRRLRVRAGIISLTQVRLANATGGTLEIFTDYILGPAERLAGEPYTWVWLSEVAPAPYWYKGIQNVELTGQFGWPQVPALIKTACLDLARERFRQGPGGSLALAPGQLAIYRDAMGRPIWGTGVPPSVLAAVDLYNSRSVIN
jgi:hypothetical protein